MKLLTFAIDGKSRPGVLKGERVIDLEAAGLPVGENGDLLGVIRGGEAALERVKEALESGSARSYKLADVAVLAPVIAPSKIVGVGLNYLDHCKEASLPVPTEPVLFGKFPNSVTGPYDDLTWPLEVTREVDYEVELGVVIGKRGRNIREAEAFEYVLGYTVVSDVSARDLQFANANQWGRGKSLDTFCPYGPYIVTRDEITDPHDLDIQCVLNGDVMQSSNTRNLIFRIPQIIAYISQGTTLMPGDLIPTGTPFGVGFSRTPPVFLKDGDECVCEVSGIGAIKNRVRLS